MKAEIISVGTELLMGQIVDTNSAYLSKALSNMGIDVFYKSTVGDNPERMRTAFMQALERSDVLITTGGLGPTDDDITKETLAELMGFPMYLNEECLDTLKARMSLYSSTTPMTSNNLKQAMMPESAVIMPNPRGTAPGCILEKDGKIAIIMPGPPYEMQFMFENHAQPFLATRCEDVMATHFVHVMGLGESVVADMLDELIKRQINPTIATYISDHDVLVRITAKCRKGEDPEALLLPVQNEICCILGNAVYEIGEDPIEKVVSDLLIKKRKTLAVAESCTGGMISSQLVNYEGASAFFLEGIVAYSNEAKIRHLQISPKILLQHGAVSYETAAEMAVNVRRISGADYGIATTGIAGPGGGSDNKPIGTVFLAVANKDGVKVERMHFRTDRTRVRARAATYILNMLRLSILTDTIE